nr:hypothetical protein [Tanacetum cinerariifolium]
IKNSNKLLKKTVGTVEQIYEPTSVEEKLDRKNEMRARGTLLMALPNKDQLKFHSDQDEKLLIEAIEKRLQKLISLLEIQDALSNHVSCAVLASQPNSPPLAREDLEQIDPDDLEEMDWEIPMLTIRAIRFIKRT